MPSQGSEDRADDWLSRARCARTSINPALEAKMPLNVPLRHVTSGAPPPPPCVRPPPLRARFARTQERANRRRVDVEVYGINNNFYSS